MLAAGSPCRPVKPSLFWTTARSTRSSSRDACERATFTAKFTRTIRHSRRSVRSPRGPSFPGGPQSVTRQTRRRATHLVFARLPTLGICYGEQLWRQLGGKVEPSQEAIRPAKYHQRTRPLAPFRAASASLVDDPRRSAHRPPGLSLSEDPNAPLAAIATPSESSTHTVPSGIRAHAAWPDLLRHSVRRAAASELDAGSFVDESVGAGISEQVAATNAPCVVSAESNSRGATRHNALGTGCCISSTTRAREAIPRARAHVA